MPNLISLWCLQMPEKVMKSLYPEEFRVQPLTIDFTHRLGFWHATVVFESEDPSKFIRIYITISCSYMQPGLSINYWIPRASTPMTKTCRPRAHHASSAFTAIQLAASNSEQKSSSSLSFEVFISPVTLGAAGQMGRPSSTSLALCSMTSFLTVFWKWMGPYRKLSESIHAISAVRTVKL